MRGRGSTTTCARSTRGCLRYRTGCAGTAAEGSALDIAEGGVEQIAKPVAEQIRSQHDEGDHEPGRSGQPPSVREVIAPFREHGAPRGQGGLDARPEEGRPR